jgi:hypothetical protein
MFQVLSLVGLVEKDAVRIITSIYHLAEKTMELIDVSLCKLP